MLSTSCWQASCCLWLCRTCDVNVTSTDGDVTTVTAAAMLCWLTESLLTSVSDTSTSWLSLVSPAHDTRYTTSCFRHSAFWITNRYDVPVRRRPTGMTYIPTRKALVVYIQWHFSSWFQQQNRICVCNLTFVNYNKSTLEMFFLFLTVSL